MRLRGIKFLSLLVLCVVSTITYAGSPKLNHFGKPAISQGAEGGLWRVDHNFDSVLHIKNVLSITSITVIPVLYMADGTEYDLSPIEIEPSGIALMSVNHALSDAPASVRSHLSDYGSASVRFTWSWPTAVLANVQNIDEINSLSFTNNLRADQNVVHAAASSVSQSLEGLWWRATSSSEAFVSLTNVSLTPINPTITVSSSTGGKATKTLPISPHNTSLIVLRDLLMQLPSDSTEGSIEINYTGKDDALVGTAGIEDFNTGYSANIPLYASASERNAKNVARISEVDYLSPGLLVGLPDPKMQFPLGTSFKPYAVMRNTTDNSLRVRILANYLDESSVKEADIGSVALAPKGVKQIDIQGMLANANLSGNNGELNLKISFVGKTGDLIFVTGSADQTKNFVFEVNPTLAGKISGRIFCYWKVHGDTDTMLSFWNYTDKDQDTTLTLYFRGGQYKIPVLLKSGESREVNIAALIRNQTPDRDGSRIPQNIEEGSAVLNQSGDEHGEIEIAAASSTFNVLTATCSVNCATCSGLVALALDPDALGAIVGTTTTAKALATYSNGTQSDFTTSATWNSSDTTIATISSGTATGIAQGQTNVVADLLYRESIYWCDGLASCPYTTFSGAGAIAVGISIGVTNFQYSSMSGGVCQYPMSCPNGNQNASCNAGTFQKAPPCPYDYISNAFIVVRKGTTKSCYGFGKAVESNTPVNCQ